MMTPLKLLIHAIWRKPLDWDDWDTSSLDEKWLYWTDLNTIEITRHNSTLGTQHTRIQNQVFVDVSETVYESLAYFRFDSEVVYRCSLIGSMC